MPLFSPRFSTFHVFFLTSLYPWLLPTSLVLVRIASPPRFPSRFSTTRARTRYEQTIAGPTAPLDVESDITYARFKPRKQPYPGSPSFSLPSFFSVPSFSRFSPRGVGKPLLPSLPLPVPPSLVVPLPPSLLPPLPLNLCMQKRTASEYHRDASRADRPPLARSSRSRLLPSVFPPFSRANSATLLAWKLPFADLNRDVGGRRSTTKSSASSTRVPLASKWMAIDLATMERNECAKTHLPFDFVGYRKG